MSERGRGGKPGRKDGKPRRDLPKGGARHRSARTGRDKPRPARAAAGGSAPGASSVHLGDEVVRELHSTSRPGKAELLVKVFADAVGAYAAGDLDEAVRLGEQAKHMALRSVAAREFLGLAYYHSGRWKEAARELAAFRRISGATSQNHVLADAYRAMERPDKALEYCDEVDPGEVDQAVFFEAAIVAAGALADQGRLDEAIARFDPLDLNPAVAAEHHLRAWYVLADLLEKKGRFTQARELFEAVEAADPDLTDAGDRAASLH